MRIARNANARDRLQGGDDAQLPEAGNIRRIDHLDVLDAVARVAPAVGLHRRLIRIERAADAAVADGVG